MTGLSKHSKDRFYELDYQVMKHAFSIHNRMGNFHDEEVYQNELLHLLQKDGIQAQIEVPLIIRFGSFEKTYYLDLVLEDSRIYELKVLPALQNQCRSQLINYQLISELPYGKLINFGGQSVEHEYVTSTLTKSKRKQFIMDDSGWNNLTESCRALQTLSRNLFLEWGSRLDPLLYTEALLSLLPETETRRIKVCSGNRKIGAKCVDLIAPDTAMKITTAKTPSPLRTQFQKFLNHTDLNTLCWINLGGNKITYKTLQRNNPVI
ncbi:MAG: GxxExxY protein [Verrucomicrobiota bacterium]